MRDEARRQLALYLARFPAEHARLAALREQLDDDAGDPMARANMRGHVTTSALVLDPTLSQVLLIHHRVIGRWLQPGGHHEAGQSLWDSALREVAEETGVSALAAHPAWGQDLPLDIDSHAIAANPAKGEGAHWHHDYAYLLIAQREPGRLRAQLDEVHAAAWWPLDEWLASGGDEPRLQGLAAKLKGLSPSSPAS
ncbi:NUDIX hydrolase [Roseateles violae]|uniref:NUDIX domain-containing protein n=1 Tax=Roseateles violae TaxID=3058042 RepID=A0ABT8DLE8_9BURK|nr:NUDIX domain-containing protein [Pelomonas sp. PFR6]MDN3919239.1 NUDIX domain-containing protein [Pelomonas sp. PFR6]